MECHAISLKHHLAGGNKNLNFPCIITFWLVLNLSWGVHFINTSIKYITSKGWKLVFAPHSGAKSQQCQIAPCISWTYFWRKLKELRHCEVNQWVIRFHQMHLLYVYIWKTLKFSLTCLFFSPSPCSTMFKQGKSFLLHARQSYTGAWL